jgi:hypothetical protein
LTDTDIAKERDHVRAADELRATDKQKDPGEDQLDELEEENAMPSRERAWRSVSLMRPLPGSDFRTRYRATISAARSRTWVNPISLNIDRASVRV